MDPEARFRRLFEETYPSIRRYALHRGLSPADADDLVADVYSVAWNKIDKVPDDPVPWLFAVARNHWRNGLRRRKRETALIGRLEPAVAPEPTDDRAPLVRLALARLGEADQEILRLTAWEGLTPQQVGVVLGCSAAAARVRLHRARKRLGETFASLQTQGSYPNEGVKDGR